jgi:hypothetical protein
MTVIAKPLIAAKQAENAQTTQYTTPAGVRALLDKFTATNTSAASASLSVNLVTAADAAGNQNLIVKTKVLAAGETYSFPELVGHVLGPGDFISTLASVATAITIRASGREVS